MIGTLRNIARLIPLPVFKQKQCWGWLGAPLILVPVGGAKLNPEVLSDQSDCGVPKDCSLRGIWGWAIFLLPVGFLAARHAFRLAPFRGSLTGPDLTAQSLFPLNCLHHGTVATYPGERWHLQVLTERNKIFNINVIIWQESLNFMLQRCKKSVTTKTFIGTSWASEGRLWGVPNGDGASDVDRNWATFGTIFNSAKKDGNPFRLVS